jgi:hypothetical protein
MSTLPYLPPTSLSEDSSLSEAMSSLPSLQPIHSRYSAPSEAMSTLPYLLPRRYSALFEAMSALPYLPPTSPQFSPL